MDARREVSGLPSAPRTTPMEAAVHPENAFKFLLLSQSLVPWRSEGREDAHIKQMAELGCSLSVYWARLGSILSPHPDSSI